VTAQDEAPQPIPRGEPLREAVYARVVALILSGRYPPGTALTEAALSRMLDVSRTPVREALLRLEAEGVLSSTIARGFTVRPLIRREVAELYPILAALEALAVRGARLPDAAAMSTLHRTAGELESCADPVQRWRLDTAWHGTLVAASGNQELVCLTTRLRVNLSRYELTYMREVQARDAADQQHREILAAITARDLPRAAGLLDEHWRQGRQLVLDWLDSHPVTRPA
jgi:DNA-binding GntR family transcriptional regulator